MKLDLNKPFDLNKFKAYCDKLILKRSKVELKELRDKRTVKQNSYLHVLINLYAIEFGYTKREAKTYLKRESSQLIYIKNNVKFLRSTADLNGKEMTDFIDWIRTHSSVNGCYLPTPKEYIDNRFEIDKDIDKHKEYL
tara:strand:+ start:35 stop:448 length:414 start_codon:yes stop_codon:yes gene_type:complete